VLYSVASAGVIYLSSGGGESRIRSKGSGDTQADFTLSNRQRRDDDDEERNIIIIMMSNRIRLLLR
jgi:hypothetical protein